MVILLRHRRYIFGAGIFLGFLAFLFSPSSSSAVTVGPTKLQISVDPGQSATGFLFVKNDESKTQTFYPLVQRFSQNANGEKLFTDDASSIAGWMRLPASVTLAAQEERQVPFTMITPADAAPGGHFAVIWWSTSPPGDGGQVSIVTRAGILVYVRVSGDITEKGYIESFGGSSRFAWGLPFNFLSGFKNEGNVALTPKGEIRVTNMFGALKTTLPVNPYGGIILPGSNGNFMSVWEGKGFFFGLYKASLDLSYGESNQTTAQSWWFVMVSPLAAAIVLLIIVLVFIAPPLLRKYNRWIIERAQQ
jgi:hypothetical protein